MPYINRYRGSSSRYKTEKSPLVLLSSCVLLDGTIGLFFETANHMILHYHQLYEILFHIHGLPSYGEERTENDVLSDFCHHYLYPSLCHFHLNSQDELIKMDYEVWTPLYYDEIGDPKKRRDDQSLYLE